MAGGLCFLPYSLSPASSFGLHFPSLPSVHRLIFLPLHCFSSQIALRSPIPQLSPPPPPRPQEDLLFEEPAGMGEAGKDRAGFREMRNGWRWGGKKHGACTQELTCNGIQKVADTALELYTY